MYALPGDVCTDPVGCAVDAVSATVQASATDFMLGGLGRAFVYAARDVAATALTVLDDSTSIDLSASWFTSNVQVIAAITLPVLVGLFTVQVIGSVLRREPGGLARAVLGVGKALVGAALALAVTQAALAAVDQVCRFVAASAGMSVAQAAALFFDFAWMATSMSPALQLLIGTVLVVSFLLLWGVLLFRKAALLLIAVFAPVAFAGSAWDATRVWTRRWLEIVAALVLSKVVIVVVFVLGAAAFSGTGATVDGQTTTSEPGLSDLLVGVLLLSIAMFAPWLTWRFVHWGGMEAATVMHSTVAANPISQGARSGLRTGVGLAQQVAITKGVGAVGGRAAAAGGGTRAATGGGARATATSRPAPPPTPAAHGAGGGR